MNRLNHFSIPLLISALCLGAASLAAQDEGSNLAPVPPSGVGEPAPSSPGGSPTLYGPRGAIFPPATTSRSTPGLEQLDADRDGRISLAEFVQPSAAASRASGGQAPAAADGKQSADERAARFHQLDRDRDGYLDRVELDSAR
ncbi:MAG TPA: hypothetical protein VG734_19960 [Lacunisphaera sp.]|nr:hypothetical protein [Lacunisphaera sp.]